MIEIPIKKFSYGLLRGKQPFKNWYTDGFSQRFAIVCNIGDNDVSVEELRKFPMGKCVEIEWIENEQIKIRDDQGTLYTFSAFELVCAEINPTDDVAFRIHHVGMACVICEDISKK